MLVLNNMILVWIGCTKLRAYRTEWVRAVNIKTESIDDCHRRINELIGQTKKFYDEVVEHSSNNLEWQKWTRGELNRQGGLVDKHIIQSKISEKYATIAHDKALDAISRVGALEKATHTIQYISAEDKIKNNEQSAKALESLMNPGNEEMSDWTAPFNEDGEVKWL